MDFVIAWVPIVALGLAAFLATVLCVIPAARGAAKVAPAEVCASSKARTKPLNSSFLIGHSCRSFKARISTDFVLLRGKYWGEESQSAKSASQE